MALGNSAIWASLSSSKQPSNPLIGHCWAKSADGFMHHSWFICITWRQVHQQVLQCTTDQKCHAGPVSVSTIQILASCQFHPQRTEPLCCASSTEPHQYIKARVLNKTFGVRLWQHSDRPVTMAHCRSLSIHDANISSVPTLRAVYNLVGQCLLMRYMDHSWFVCITRRQLHQQSLQYKY